MSIYDFPLYSLGAFFLLLLIEGTLCGPLHTKASVGEFEAAIADIKKAGGKIEIGGQVLISFLYNFNI